MKTARQIFLFLLFPLFLLCASLFASCASEIKNEPAIALANSAPALSKKDRISALNDAVFCISIIVKDKDSVVVKGKSLEKKFAVGTGFIVGGGYLASALHVETKAAQMAKDLEKNTFRIVAWKIFPSGEHLELPIELFVSDKNTDLAIYRFDDKPLKETPRFAAIKPLALAEQLPPVGEEVVSIGYYGDYQFPFNSIGNVSMIDKNEDIFSDVTIVPGNSGGPICSLETGEVLGVTVSVLDLGNETVRFGIAKRASKLRELLRKLERKN
jgi:S1-C subfamily serine protease